MSKAREWLPEHDDLIRDGYQAGWPCEFIARQIGGNVTARVVNKRASTIGIKHSMHTKNSFKRVTMPGAGLPTCSLAANSDDGEGSCS